MLTPFDRWAADSVVNGSAWGLIAIFAVCGFVVSRWCWHWIDCLTWDVSPFSGSICPFCGTPRVRVGTGRIFDGQARRATLPSSFPNQAQPVESRVEVAPVSGDLPMSPAGELPPTQVSCGHRIPGRWWWSLLVAILFAGYAWAVGKGECQSLTEGGSIDWIHWRIIYHLFLITLLITATGIDFRVYLIPDSITLTGVIVGIGGAVWFGNLHLIPVWIDANQEVPGIHGPYIPDWIKVHWHWHGLAWSVCGLVAGAGVTWLVRLMSFWILGREALGFGDVTLMAMIGSFTGWQPILLIFAFAPLCGIVMVLCAHFLCGKNYIPYGPYLSLSTLIVLLTWKWQWKPLRYVFGHAPTMLALAAGAFLTLAVLLGCLRLYRALPGRRPAP